MRGATVSTTTMSFNPAHRLPFVRLAAAAACLGLCGAANAASINYGDFVVPPYVFQQVTESSGTDPVPLFGPPAPFVTGLGFNPTSFVATASGGASDITDGQLNFGVLGGPGSTNPINSISLTEAGDYTLVGSGTTLTQADAGVIIRVQVTAINGSPVAPITLSPSNNSVAFNLIANPGLDQPWSLGANVNVAAALAGLNIPGNATRVNVAIDNTLVAVSQTSSLSFIAKKEFDIVLNPGVPIPEPATATMALAVAAMGGLGTRIRRRSTTPAA